MHTQQFVIMVVVFAILFPLLKWAINRKTFSWLESVIAIAIYAGLMAVFNFTVVGTWFSLH